MKRIVYCSDGTWNKATGDRTTNVARMKEALVNDRVHQFVEYDEGVGNEGGFLRKLVGGATGAGLERNVLECYEKLASLYEGPEDEIFLFGYSRGAYTVRSAVGLIRKCGLLRREELHRTREAYDLYRRRDPSADPPDAVRFRKAYSHERPIIRLVGVWDTVGARGLPGVLAPLTAWRHRFHDVKLSGMVKEAYHAVAVDERRLLYRPTLWETPETPTDGQKVEQTWFAGAHGNVGGGYQDKRLSALTFRWMRVRAEGAGLRFDEEKVSRFEKEADPLGPIDDTAKGFWQFTGVGARAMGREEERPQNVAPSVELRWDVDPSYRPRNLADYWRRHPRKNEGRVKP